MIQIQIVHNFDIRKEKKYLIFKIFKFMISLSDNENNVILLYKIFKTTS